MAEARNSFIKSKMNKDLDERLLPSGELGMPLPSKLNITHNLNHLRRLNDCLSGKILVNSPNR